MCDYFLPILACVVSGDFPDQNQFPTAPQNLSVNFHSDTQAELTWTRPTEDRLANDFASGYEIFRDGVFIARLPVVTSYFDADANPNASYEVRATRGLIAGTSSFVNTSGNEVGPEIGPEIGLTGTVYSSTALELFYSNTEAGSSAVTYNILRDGVVIRENSVATSQFDAGLAVNTTYRYDVEAVLDGRIISTDSISLTTFDEGSGATSTLEVNVTLSGAVYSSSALELFWNRTQVSGAAYNVYRDGVLVRENTPAISHFDGQLPPNNSFVYEVVALVGGDVVASDTIEINTSSGLVTEAPQIRVAPIELIGSVYSSTALELTWNRDDIPGVTYNIVRDGQLIRESSPATSQFQSGLLPGTRYLYTVTPFLNGVEQTSETIELITRDI